MDPFKEVSPEDEVVTRELLEDLHGSFQDVVLASRKGKLTAPHSELFSGARPPLALTSAPCAHSLVRSTALLGVWCATEGWPCMLLVT